MNVFFYLQVKQKRTVNSGIVTSVDILVLNCFCYKHGFENLMP